MKNEEWKMENEAADYPFSLIIHYSLFILHCSLFISFPVNVITIL
jgi:hypothetical protein